MTERGTPAGAGALTPRRSLVCLVALVVAASVAATAHGLYAVAVTSGVPWQVAYLYPLITDGLALVAYWATKQLRSARYPWLVIVVAAGLSGLAQAVNLAGLGESPTWLRFGVGYWPAVAVLFAAHLLWLVGRPRVQAGAGLAAVEGDAETAGGPGATPIPVPGPPAPDQEDEAWASGLSSTTSSGSSSPPASPPSPAGSGNAGSDLGGLTLAMASNGNGHGATLRTQAERKARRYLAENGALPSENVLAGLAQCSRGTARNALAPLRKGT